MAASSSHAAVGIESGAYARVEELAIFHDANRRLDGVNAAAALAF